MVVVDFLLHKSVADCDIYNNCYIAGLSKKFYGVSVSSQTAADRRVYYSYYLASLVEVKNLKNVFFESYLKVFVKQ